jgi:Family of unknown function (DUF6308)
MRSIGDLELCARRHLDEYTDSTKLFAFATYDSWWGRSPDVVTPAEILMANCLSLQLSADEVTPLFTALDTPATRLRRALQVVLDEIPHDGSVRFEDLASIDDPRFRLFRTACAATSARDGLPKVAQWTATTVSKVLHRLRPHLVPVNDSVVRRFYGVPDSSPSVLYERLHADLAMHRSWLAGLASEYPTPDARQLSLLRAADIVIWHHDTSGCAG